MGLVGGLAGGLRVAACGWLAGGLRVAACGLAGSQAKKSQGQRSQGVGQAQARPFKTRGRGRRVAASEPALFSITFAVMELSFGNVDG